MCVQAKGPKERVILRIDVGRHVGRRRALTLKRSCAMMYYSNANGWGKKQIYLARGRLKFKGHCLPTRRVRLSRFGTDTLDADDWPAPKTGSKINDFFLFQKSV